jgi:VanZ family protein
MKSRLYKNGDRVAVPMALTGRNFLKYWAPALAVMVVIFAASTDLMSAKHTSRLIAPFLMWLVPDISSAALLQVQFVVRKAAHLVEYALLGSLLLRALRAGQGRVRWSLGGAAVGVAALCAAADEYHQSFVGSRTGSAGDVMIDIVGACVGVAIYWRLTQQRAARAAAAVNVT